VANHGGHQSAQFVVQRELPLVDTFERGQQDRDLRQAGGVHHAVAVDMGQTGVLRIGDIDERDGQLTPLHRPVKIQAFDALFQLVLEGGILDIPKLREIFFCVNNLKRNHQPKQESQHCYASQHATSPPGLQGSW